MTTCRVCAFTYADDQPKCPRCGFGSSGPSLAAPPVEASKNRMEGMVNLVPEAASGQPTVSIGGAQASAPDAEAIQNAIQGAMGALGNVPGMSAMSGMGIPTAAPRRRGVILFMVMAFLVALPLAGFLVVKPIVDKVSDAIPDIQGVLDDSGVFGEDGPGNIAAPAEPDKMTPEQCRTLMSRYLKKLFFAMNKDPNKLSALFIDASQRFGAGSAEYRRLVEIFSTTELSSAAALGDPGKAYKKSKKLVAKSCKG